LNKKELTEGKSSGIKDLGGMKAIMDKYIVEETVEINAPVSKAWDVLTKTKYHKQWNDIPDNFYVEVFSLGTVIEWEGFCKLTVTEYEINKLFKLSAFFQNIALKPEEYDVSYTFKLKNIGRKTILDIKLGDYINIPGGRDFYNESIEFANRAKFKIKELAEQMV
jgi:hypothetical protein